MMSVRIKMLWKVLSILKRFGKMEKVLGIVKTFFKSKNVSLVETTFGVDPTGFAPVSLGVNTSILLHILQARIHKIIIKQKEPLFKRFRLLTPSESP